MQLIAMSLYIIIKKNLQLLPFFCVSFRCIFFLAAFILTLAELIVIYYRS